MTILNRYIMRTMIQTTLIVVLAIMSMDFFIELINEFNNVGKGNFGIGQAFLFVISEMPRDFYQLFPITGLIGCLLGLGLLASHSELIVMRSAGQSALQISFAVLSAILIMVSCVVILGEGIAPHVSHLGENYKIAAKSGGQAVATQEGIWLRDKSDFIHIQKVLSMTSLQGLSRYQFDNDHRLRSVSYAKTAIYVEGIWKVSQIAQTTISNQTVKTTQKALDEWQMTLNPTILKMVKVLPQEMSLFKLYAYNQYRKNNNLQYSASALNFWQRIFHPFDICIMMLLAIPFIFGPLRSVTMGLRLVSGVIVGFGFYLLNQFFGPFSLVYHVPPILAASIPSVLFLILGFVLMRRVT